MSSAKFVSVFDRLKSAATTRDSHEYTQTSDYETLLSGSSSFEASRSEKTPPAARQRYLYGIITFASALFFAALSLLLAGAYMLKTPTETQCVKELSTWSPLSDVVKYKEMDFDNDFAHQTQYRGPPTDTMDRAWSNFWLYEGLEIPIEKMPLLNRSATAETYKPTEDGKGSHALMEVFHQIHCLDVIRQYTWRDYYLSHEDKVHTPANIKSGEVAARMHVDHCIEALRITLMCHGDITPYLGKVDPGSPVGASADFSPHHKCVDFETIWRMRNWGASRIKGTIKCIDFRISSN